MSISVDDFYIERIKRTKPYTMNKYHYHDFYEIYYLLAGERTYYIENESYELKKGSLLFIHKNHIHKTVAKGEPGHERTLVHLSESFLGPFAARQLGYLLTPFQSNNKMLELTMQEMSYVENILFQMEQEYMDASRSGREACIGALLVQLLVFAARTMEKQPEKQASPLHSKIAEVIAYCHVHFDKPLRLETISELFYISPYHFVRLFKRMTGFTFTEYVNTVRIREAQRLVRETRGKMIEISAQVGFPNVSHFNRKFKEVTTMSPMEYRKMVNKPEAGR